MLVKKIIRDSALRASTTAAEIPAATATTTAPPPRPLVKVQGWVKSVRAQKKYTFVNLNDGSTAHDMQVVLETDRFATLKHDLTTGSCASFEGTLAPNARNLEINELCDVTAAKVLGTADPATYPLQKKKHSDVYMRENLGHLRARSTTFGARMRIRSGLASCVRDFFEKENDFIWISTPVLTKNDCEGAGELFQVMTGTPPIFFGGDKVFLTVSGQLHAEMFASGLNRVYTFGPTFRAENSNTTRHLSEFWMIEPEFAFSTAEDAMALAEGLLRRTCRHALDFHAEDLSVLEKYAAQEEEEEEPERNHHDARHRRLEEMSNEKARAPFPRISYVEAVRVLERNGFVVEKRASLSSSHERFLVEKYFDGTPAFVYDFPREAKPFYALANEDEHDTAAAFDLLVPGVGELAGGSAREHRVEALEKRMRAAGLLPTLEWYLDLRRYGTVPHAGFGVGFERLVQFVTGCANIRDCIPIPRYPGSMNF